MSHNLLLNELQVLPEVQITVREELGVRRVIVLVVEVDQLLILQISDVSGLTSRIKAILRLLKEILV